MSVTVLKKAFTFFKTLEKNNNRDWFNNHKPEFKAIESDVKNIYNSYRKIYHRHATASGSTQHPGFFPSGAYRPACHVRHH